MNKNLIENFNNRLSEVIGNMSEEEMKQIAVEVFKKNQDKILRRLMGLPVDGEDYDRDAAGRLPGSSNVIQMLESLISTELDKNFKQQLYEEIEKAVRQAIEEVKQEFLESDYLIKRVREHFSEEIENKLLEISEEALSKIKTSLVDEIVNGQKDTENH